MKERHENKVSVIICTHNPILSIVSEVLEALKSQTLNKENWQLLIIDNNSTILVQNLIDLAWHGNAKIIVEKKQGLAHARIRGVKEAQNDLIVFIDDDNVADNEYLEKSIEIVNQYPTIGAFGGKANPVFQEAPILNAIHQVTGLLGCRDLGNKTQITHIVDGAISEYPSFSPIGTGMVIRKQVFEQYISEIENSSFRTNLGRKGKELTSGEDNDIVITALKKGWQVGYFPQLIIQHIIPSFRTTKVYLAKMNFAQNKSWVQLLAFHGISNWKQIAKWSISLRKLKAWYTYKAYQSEVNYIKWKGACGMYEGLAK